MEDETRDSEEAIADIREDDDEPSPEERQFLEAERIPGDPGDDGGGELTG